MPDINKIKDDVSVLTKKIEDELKNLTRVYQGFCSEVDSRFQDELREQDGKMDGLEDFYGLKLIVNRNRQSVNNALGIILRLKDISGFNISETSEKIEKNKIKELFT